MDSAHCNYDCVDVAPCLVCRGRLNWQNHGAQRASIRSIRGAETHTVVRSQTDKNLRCRHALRRLKHGSCGHHARGGSFRLCVLAPAGQEARRATSGAPPKGAGLQHTHTQATGAGRQKSDIEGGRSPSRGARTGCSNSVGSSRGRANAAGGGGQRRQLSILCEFVGLCLMRRRGSRGASVSAIHVLHQGCALVVTVYSSLPELGDRPR